MKDAKLYFTQALQVDEIHTLHIEEWGNPQGEPVIFLHGGPGGSISEKCAEFFDGEKYRIILFDQRGCGKSRPFLELKNNTVADSVEDMEKIREHLKIDRWILFGGSYGSTLSLCYAIAHPERVKHLVLRGIFLGRDEDIRWLYQEGAGYFYPEKFEAFKNHIAPEKRGDLVKAYYELLTHKDPKVRDKAAVCWANWESGIVNLVSETLGEEIEDWKRSIALLECHYFVHHMFWEKDSYILDHLDRIKEIPLDIVHGRYDVDCRLCGAYLLHQKHKNSKLHIVEAAGHSSEDEPMFEKLKEIMDRL